MHTLAYTLSAEEPGFQKTIAVQTTLYELIEAIGSEIRPEEEALITTTVSHLISSGKVRIITSL